MQQPLVQFQKVCKEYSNKLIIDQVSFSILPSSITVLIGPNGAGKTTIAKLLLGLDAPSKGKILKSKGIKVNYVPQKFEHNFLLPLTVRDFLYSQNIELEDFFQTPLFNKSDYLKVANLQISNFSGGQLQKLFLASSLTQKPDLIVLDEPTSYLDIEGKNNFYNLIENIRQERKISIFMISHDLHTVINTADQVLCLNHHLCCKGRPIVQLSNMDTSLGIYDHHHDHKHTE